MRKSSIIPLIALFSTIGQTTMESSVSSKDKKSFKKSKKRIDSINLERLKKQGLNEYNYNGNIIYARNKKNADRKAKNKGFLNY